jgi:hypothetical protein
MKLREFRCTSLAMLGELLDVHKDNSEWLHHFPVARFGSIYLNSHRDPNTNSTPFTDADVMPHLKSAPVDPHAKDKAILLQLSAALPGFALEVEED